MISLKDNKIALCGMPVTIAALEKLDRLIGFYSVNKPGPAYVSFKHLDFGNDDLQIERTFMVECLKRQRQHLVDYLGSLGIEVDCNES